jgi:hypothetical protein
MPYFLPLRAMDMVRPAFSSADNIHGQRLAADDLICPPRVKPFVQLDSINVGPRCSAITGRCSASVKQRVTKSCELKSGTDQRK